MRGLTRVDRAVAISLLAPITGKAILDLAARAQQARRGLVARRAERRLLRDGALNPTTVSMQDLYDRRRLLFPDVAEVVDARDAERVLAAHGIRPRGRAGRA